MEILDLVKTNPQFTSRRLPSLYADFRRLKTTNEDGFAANIAAWKGLLTNALSNGEIFDDVTCIKADNALIDSLSTPEHGRPLALDVVFDELVAEKKLIPLPEFFGPYSIYGRRWGVRPIMSWALRTSGLWDTTWKSRLKDGLKSVKYVSVATLEEVAKAVLAKLSAEAPSYTHTVYTRSMFEKTAGELQIGGRKVLLSQTDLDCVIQYLSRDRPCMVADKNVIKINLAGSKTAVNEITEQDRAVAHLRGTADQVSERVDALSSKIDACTERAKTALEKKNKQVARYALKSRKLAEQAQSSSLDMLSNLETVLIQIDNASGHVEIVSALQSGVSILGNLNKAVGGAERVSELMDEMKDHVSETDEIGREIAQLSQGVDDDGIDEELAQIEQEELAARLGKVPTPASKPVEDPMEELEKQTENMHLSTENSASSERNETDKQDRVPVPN